MKAGICGITQVCLFCAWSGAPSIPAWGVTGGVVGLCSICAFGGLKVKLQGTICAPTVSLSHWRFVFCSSLWGVATAPRGVRWSVGVSAPGGLGAKGPRVRLLLASPARANPSVCRDPVKVVGSGGIGVCLVGSLGRAVGGVVCPGSSAGAAIWGRAWVRCAAGRVVHKVRRNVLSRFICALSAGVVRGVGFTHVVSCNSAVRGQHTSASPRRRVL